MLLVVWLIVTSPLTPTDPTPEIRAGQVDIVVPEVTTGPPATGERVKIIDVDSAVAILASLPHDSLPTKSWLANQVAWQW